MIARRGAARIGLERPPSPMRRLRLPGRPCLPNASWVLLLALTAPGMDAARAQDGLGRLFTTPAQREALDTLRERGPLPAPVRAPIEQAAEPIEAEVLPDVTVSGVVVRSGGRSSAWVNGRMVGSGDVSIDGVQVDAGRGGRSVSLVLPDSGERLLVRPGQRIEVNSGRVLESYEFDSDVDSPSAFAERADSDPPTEPARAPRSGTDSLTDTTERTLEAIRTLRDLFSGITGDGR